MAAAAPVSLGKIAPQAGRSVLVSPNVRVNLAAAGHPLANYVPKTQLGNVALELVVTTSTSLISVAATTAYVYALIELSLPPLTFQAPPPGTTLSPQSLQSAYQQFNTQVDLFQGEASAWVDTQPGTSSPSILTQLVSIPTTFATINGTVQSQFTILSALTPGTTEYQNTLTQLESLIGAESPSITSLNASMKTLGTNLVAATTSIATAGTTGVLAQLIQAYQSEITALTNAVNTANSQISSDNKQIAGYGVTTGANVVLGVLALGNFWNPLGWIMIGSSAVGAYNGISEIETLKAQVAQLQATIQADELWETTDSQAAASIQLTITQTQGFSSMNAAAQKELTALENLLSTLGSDITTALTDLNQNDLQDALAEWNEIVSAAAVLANVSAYMWPSPILLSNPTALAGAGSNLYAVTVSGQSYSYASGAANWVAMSGKSLSIVAAGSLIVGINGAPNDGTQASPTPYPTNFFVKTFNPSNNVWTTISTFPASQVATDGTSIYAINQSQASRQIFKFSSGTTWTGIAVLPNSDAAQDLAVANGTLVAISNNSQQAYIYNGSTWSVLRTGTYMDVTANGTKIGLIDTNNNSYLYDVSTRAFAYNGSSTATNIVQLAQVSNGDQYVINNAQNLYYLNNQGSTPQWTLLKTNAVGVAVSNTGAVYYSDNLGNTYVLTNLGSNAWTQLPAFPTSAS